MSAGIPTETSEQMGGELEPCPFCGGGAKLFQGNTNAWVLCGTPGCGCEQVHDSKEQVVAAWNTRTPNPETSEQMGVSNLPEELKPLGVNPKLDELMVLVAIAAARESGCGSDLEVLKKHAAHATKLWNEHQARTIPAQDALVGELREALVQIRKAAMDDHWGVPKVAWEIISQIDALLAKLPAPPEYEKETRA